MPTDANVESTLIHFKHGTAGNWKHWTAELEKFLHRKLSVLSLVSLSISLLFLIYQLSTLLTLPYYRGSLRKCVEM